MKRLLMILLSCMVTCGASAAATGPVSPMANSKYNTKLPIEISSDTLEVLQQENKAIFKGNVIAVQGQMRLKSDVMIVHYRQQDNKNAAPKPAEPPQAPKTQGEMGAISLIEVEGHVFVASPEESAQGDKGDYNVDDKTIHLFGDNVVLTREKNILRGTALEYNLATGRSVLTNGSKVVSGKNDGRVRGVFVPNQDNKTPDKDKVPAKDKQPAQSIQASPPVQPEAVAK